MCARPSNYITDALASTAPCTPVQLWATLGGHTATCRPLPPPPLSQIGGASPVVCPTGPHDQRGNSAAPGNLPGQVPGQGSAQRAQGALHLPPAPQAVGVWDPASTAAPPVPTGSQGARVPPSRAWRTPVHVRTHTHTRAPRGLGLGGSVGHARHVHVTRHALWGAKAPCPAH